MKFCFFLFFVFVFALIGFSSAQNEPEVSTTTTVKPAQVDLCPSPSEIQPCFCHSYDTKRGSLGMSFVGFPRFFVTVLCRGENVTELSFDKLINALHQRVQIVQEQLSRDSDAQNENQNQDETSDTPYSIHFSNTSITKLDLTSLIQTSLKVNELRLTNNFNLTTVTGPSPSTISKSASNKIPCQVLEIRNSPVADRDIGKILSFLVPEELNSLEVTGTMVEGSGGKLEDKNKDCPTNPLDSEFFPGLSAFTNLRFLSLEKNKIKVLRCAPFISQGRHLIDLRLNYNPLEYIGENGLLFTSSSEDSNSISNPDVQQNNNTNWFRQPVWSGYFIHIDITNSTLDENKFMENSGLDKNNQTIYLHLIRNKFKSLPEALFRPFVEKPGNFLHIYEPLLSCDEKLKWVQEFLRKSMIFFGRKKCDSMRSRNEDSQNQSQDTKTTVSD